MQRYHEKVYFPIADKIKLESFTLKLNTLKWQYTSHALANIKYRAIDLENLLYFISTLKLESNQIFEYYKMNDALIKVCYRIAYKDYDFILVLTENKRIVTIYLNAKNDKHDTLKKYLYVTS